MDGPSSVSRASRGSRTQSTPAASAARAIQLVVGGALVLWPSARRRWAGCGAPTPLGGPAKSCTAVNEAASLRGADRLTPSAQAPSVEGVTCRVVCISHATGAGGEEVGRLVAERLGFLYVDHDIVARAAARGGIRPADVADAERRKPLVSRLLEALAQSSEVGTSALVEGVDSENIRALIRETIDRTAARGDAVIVAHGASHLVEAGDDALRVLVTASPATRAGRLEAVEALDPAKAVRAVKDSDAGRRDYLKRFYDVGEELPIHYDLVVNTDALSVELAAELVIRAASR